MAKRLSVLGLAVLLGLTLVLPAAARSSSAWLRVVHAASTTGGVDVFVDGSRMLANVQLRDISQYLSFPAGEHSVAVAPAGAGIQAALFTQRVTLNADQAYTLAAVGLQNVSAQIYTDDLSAPPSGKARVRVIHASPDAPVADVEVVNGPTLIQNLAFPDASKYLQVDPGAYNLQVVAVGDNSVFVRLPNTQVKAGVIYDVVAIGRLADIEVAVATYTPAAGASQPGERAMLPSAGAPDVARVLLLCGALLALGAGLLLRRQMV